MAGTIPTSLSSFIGRTQELAELTALLGADGTRLVTLTGPGGVGKTRLAAQVALAVQSTLEDGVCWVALDGLSDPQQLPGAVLNGLGVASSGGPPAQALLPALATRHLLLILDNCEHLLAAAAELTDRLLRAAPSLQILATSRERLNVSGERAWLVPGMAVPQAVATGDEVLTTDAVQLFVERAAAMRPSFQLTAETAAAVIAICRQVDGLPLAVELAAARSHSLGVEQIAARLRERLDVLSGGRRGAPTRQQTLRATFDWSHDLLTAREKVLFRRLAIFQGRFTLEAAEAVCSQAGGDDQNGESSLHSEAILDLLGSLVDKSLVTVERADGDEATYRLLELIRRYAYEQLAVADELDASREAHLSFYADLVRSAREGLKGAEQRAWVQTLTLAQANVYAALRTAIELGRTEAGIA
ncbi:MAG: NB-ARC domain-containing protein, partial [Anaerolineae bacterium]|nr:NB-ARC domain-containing protein [Anaerolineae bacterium]